MTNERNQQLKDTFDYIKTILGNIEELIENALKKINLILKVTD